VATSMPLVDFFSVLPVPFTSWVVSIKGGTYEECHTSLCVGAECAVKKDSSTLDGSEHPFVAALLQQEDRSYAGGDAATCG